MTEKLVVLVSDLDSCRPKKLCHGGTRKVFAQLGLDWSTFVSQGLPAEDILATGNGFAKRIVEAAQRRVLGEKDGRQ